MRLLYRLLPPSPPIPAAEGAHTGGRARSSLDLVVDVAADATVGDVADEIESALARECSSRSAETGDAGSPVAGDRSLARAHDTRAPGRSEPAARALPLSGSTIRLQASGAAEHSRSPSPVVLHRAGDPPRRLDYGTSAVDLPGIPAAASVEVGHCIRVLAGAATVAVDGAAVHGATTVVGGQVLDVGGQTLVVGVEGELRPPPADGPLADHLPTRALHEPHEPVTVELPSAPGDVRLPGWPVLSAAVPVLMGVVLWWVTRSLAMAGFVLFSFAFVVASAIETRRESRAERRFREAEFRSDLDDAAERLRVLRRAEVDRLSRRNPHVDDLVVWAIERSARRWERSPSDPGAMTVRIGSGTRTPSDAVSSSGGGRRDLRELADAVAADHRSMEAPIVVDLDEVGGLAVVGGGEPALAVARSVVVQLATLVDPTGLHVELRCPPERLGAWEWLGWLHRSPPTSGPARRLVVVDTTGGASLPDLTDPAGAPAPGGGADPGDDVTRVLWLADGEGGLPRTIGAVAGVGRVDGSPGYLRLADGARAGCAVEGITHAEAEAAARSLAGCRPAAVGPGRALVAGSLDGEASVVRLGDVIGRRPVNVDGVLARWARAGVGLAAPIGTAGGGVLHLDVERDGPHGLVAGTTGAGKSEALRTLVASLALHHPPERVTFLLVDYKGGSAFGSLTDLPHTVGVVTDLTPALARRALTSLRSEVRRRESLLRDAGHRDLATMRDAGTAGCPPSLVVVVDEFAALARDLPELLEGVVDLAQRGRSLGIHLVLATQRPAGVVTDSIRANTGFRLALRVTDADESRDVVDAPGAADLPRDQPGSALLRLGPGALVPLRTAWTGGPAATPPKVRVRTIRSLLAGAPEAPTGAGHHGPTEADLVVEVTAEATRRLGSIPPRSPWLAELPRRLVRMPRPAGPHLRDGSAGPAGEARQCLDLGLLDDPEGQLQPFWSLDLAAAGGLAVLGGPRSGTTTALLSAAAGMLRIGATVVGIDAASGLAPLAEAGAATVVGVDDSESVLRVLRSLASEVALRSTSSPPAVASDASRPVLVVVDGLGQLERAHERVNRGEAMELLERIASGGRSVGVHVAVTARQRADVPPTLLSHLGHRVVLRCTSDDDALVLGAPGELADPELPPGRGFVTAGRGAGLWVQVLLPPSPPAGPPVPVPPVPRLPDLVRAVPGAGGRNWELGVGVAAGPWEVGDASLPVGVLDLSDGHAVVTGPPGSGRTSALRTLASAAVHVPTRVLVSSRPPARGAVAGEHQPWTHVLHVDPYAERAEAEEALGRLPIGDGLALVAVDDLPELLDGPVAATVSEWLAPLVRPGRAGGVRVVAAGEADAVAHTFDASLRRMRSSGRGLLLCPDPDLHPSLLHTTLPPHDEISSAPGRGWLVHPDGVVAVQVALT